MNWRGPASGGRRVAAAGRGGGLLGFADIDEGDVFLTPEGQRFAEAGVLEEKDLFRKQALGRCVPAPDYEGDPSGARPCASRRCLRELEQTFSARGAPTTGYSYRLGPLCGTVRLR